MYIKLLAFPLKENVYLVTENQTIWKINMREKRKTKQLNICHLEDRAKFAKKNFYLMRVDELSSCGSKCKQTKRQGSKDCLWNHIFTFLSDYYFFFLANKTGSVIGCNLSKKHKLALYQIQSGEPNYVHNKILL